MTRTKISNCHIEIDWFFNLDRIRVIKRTRRRERGRESRRERRIERRTINRGRRRE